MDIIPRDARNIVFDYLHPNEVWIVRHTFPVLFSHTPSSKKRKRSMLPVEFAQWCAGSGYIDLLAWTFTIEGPDYGAISLAAIREGQLDVLKYLLVTFGFLHSEATIKEAVGYQKANIVKWLIELGYIVTRADIMAAVYVDSLPLAVLLRSYHRSRVSVLASSPFLTSVAAENNNLDMLRFLFEEGVPINSKACRYAAGNGNLDMLKWLRSKGVPWDFTITDQAIERDNMDVLVYAISNGCPLRDL